MREEPTTVAGCAAAACRRLAREEEGAVLAITVIVFLVLFVMACSVYAIGETARQRVELQNLADAAVYSGALTQADTISRVATINRALSWTYVQLGRMDMDAIVDKWLEMAITRYMPNYAYARAVAMASSCATGPFTGWDDWYAGDNYTPYREHIRLNKKGTQWIHYQTIIQTRVQAAANGSSYMTLLFPIQEYRTAIKDMNRAEEDLIDRMRGRVRDTMTKVLDRYPMETENDRLAGRSDFQRRMLVADGRTLFRKLKASEEETFLEYGEYMGGPQPTFDTGIDDWFRLEQGGDGFQRRYRQQGQRLVADWYWQGGNWQWTSATPPVCVRVFTTGRQHNEVRGQEGWDSQYYETERAYPWKLKKNFFDKDGTVTLAISRPLVNPFFFVFRTLAEAGIFKGFEPESGPRSMWVAVAARAGHGASWPGRSAGDYDPTLWPGGEDDVLNLKNTDWDAVLLPLHRAWSPAESRSWDKDTAAEILLEMLGAGGTPAAPRGMSGAVDWGAAEGWVVH